MNQNLAIIPVINKIDLPSAHPEQCKQQIEDILAIPADEAILASGKSGIGIKDILDAVVERVPPPRLADYKQARALIFDCVFDTYKGVICYVRVFSGTFKAGDEIMMMSNGAKTSVKEVGRFTPSMLVEKDITAGHTGYIVTNIKDVTEIKIGDTITLASDRRRNAARLQGGKAHGLCGRLPDRYGGLRKAKKLACAPAAKRCGLGLPGGKLCSFGLWF